MKIFLKHLPTHQSHYVCMCGYETNYYIHYNPSLKRIKDLDVDMISLDDF